VGLTDREPIFVTSKEYADFLKRNSLPPNLIFHGPKRLRDKRRKKR
jgi:hypothetical protein